MKRWIDGILSKITMYKLILYYLLALLGIAFLFSATGWLPYTFLGLAFSTVLVLGVCLWTNVIFSMVAKVQTNTESVYITALILILIITPPGPGTWFPTISLLCWASILAMASKYIFSIRNKHVFNPAAFAVVVTALTLNQSASWWIGTSSMLFFVILGGYLVIRKVQRIAMAGSFLLTALGVTALLSFSEASLWTTAHHAIVLSPLIFFTAVMLTEPLTTPPTKRWQIVYGCLVGILFSPQFHIGSLYLTPELALLVGNVFTYLVSPKGRYIMTLVSQHDDGKGVRNFIFRPDKKVDFQPGQYMEWTLGHTRVDSRGNRRYFTIASSPTEPTVWLGVKFYDKPSSFKSRMLSMQTWETVIASQIAGEFTLPKDPTKKLVFIAGGIGITPFRSMLKYLIDKKEKRSVVTLYSCNTEEEISYKDVWREAQQRLGCKTVVTLTNIEKISPQWTGQKGFITDEMIVKEVPDYRERMFYISGPHSIVEATKSVLKKLGIPQSQIKTDFFPGLA
ncbi:MAG: RnfABCDGE type electron transport complex subunit D [bacterium]|nr:RnfABCDGE type electron transport complex subunit D [bacterium]